MYIYFKFIYMCLCWVLVDLLGLSLAVSGCSMWASLCGDFFCCGARALAPRVSVVLAPGFSCATACGNPPGPGIEPRSPALAGRRLSTVYF